MRLDDLIGTALAGVAIICFSLAIVWGVTSLAASAKHDEQCDAQCERRGKRDHRANGTCVCRDGSVWIWTEGYTTKLGKR